MTTLLASGWMMLLLDQSSKNMARRYLGNRCLAWGPVLRLTCVRHLEETYKRRVPRVLLVLVWVAAFVSAVTLYRSGGWFQAPLALVGLGLAFGGATGNLLDILRLRCVVDFIDLRWWPIFNLADLAIVAGLALAFLG